VPPEPRRVLPSPRRHDNPTHSKRIMGRSGEPNSRGAGKSGALGVKPKDGNADGRAESHARTRQLTSQACRRENPTVHTKSTSTLHRYRRPSAITLTAVCVLAGGGIATAAPASASETAVTPVAASTVTGPLPWRAGSQPLVWTQPVHRAPVRRIVSHLTAAAITPSKTTVRPGVAVTLTGTVSYGAAILVRAQLVTLQVRNGSSWQTVETQRLSGTGSATFTVKPTVSQTYRLAFGGSRGLTPATAFHSAPGALIIRA